MKVDLFQPKEWEAVRQTARQDADMVGRSAGHRRFPHTTNQGALQTEAAHVRTLALEGTGAD